MQIVDGTGQAILVIDDEEQALISISAALKYGGFHAVTTCQDSRNAVPLLQSGTYTLVFLDLHMPHVSGWDLLEILKDEYPETPVIIMTADDEVESAVQCMKQGAIDYLVKPVNTNRLAASTRQALNLSEARIENAELRDHLLSTGLRYPDAFAAIVTRSNSMISIFQYIESVAVTTVPVLLSGETGTGKELVARCVHTVSGRRGDFVTVNVAGLDDTLFSDTLFGHTTGAFTNAVKDRQGLIVQAAAGTLFLDEIGDLSPPSQVKLLRLLQEREYYPLGSDSPMYSNARLVFATNHDIKSLAEDGEFRKDLYFRLQSHHVRVPPLRDRLEDIPILVDHFVKKAAKETRKRPPSLPEELFTILRLHHFPGNIRELEGLILESMIRHTAGTLSLALFRDLLDADQLARADTGDEGNPLAGIDPLPTLQEARRIVVAEAMRRAENNQSIAARLLGISRQALNSILRRNP